MADDTIDQTQPSPLQQLGDIAGRAVMQGVNPLSGVEQAVPHIMDTLRDYVSGAYNVEPVEHDPFAPQATDVSGVGYVPTITPKPVDVAGRFAASIPVGMYDWVKSYSDVQNEAQNIKSKIDQQGYMTEEDQFRMSNLDRQAATIGASSAYNMVLGGVGGAETGAAGVAGGRLKNVAREDHPALIDTRLPTSKEPIDTGPGPKRVDVDTLKLTPDLYEKNVNLVRDYPGVKIPARATTDTTANMFVDYVKDNLEWLYNQVPDDIKYRSSQWYDGGNKIVNDMAKKYDVNDSTAAAVIAATSPQKDWFQNVSFADRILESMRGDKDFYENYKFTPQMAEQFEDTPSMHKYRPIMEEIADKSLADIDKVIPYPDDVRHILKAMWIRLHDQANREPGYNLVTPEGNFGDIVRKSNGAPARIQWGSLKEIGKAVTAIDENGDPAVMQTLMGNRHKIRNFYNNLLDPMSQRGDVTIDTHAVAAGLLRPVSSNSLEVTHNFKTSPEPGLPSSGYSALTGISGTYPLYADAYRKAAQELGILPRQLQSVTWEAVRGLFPEDWKNRKNSAIIDNIWRQYKSGKASIDDTRQRILQAAGGVDPPSWYYSRSPGVAPGTAWNPLNAPELFEPRVYGQSAPAALAGRGSGPARAAAAPELTNGPARNVTLGSGATDERGGWGGLFRAAGVGETPREAKAASFEQAKADARASAERVAEGRQPLIGLPQEHITRAGYFVPGPIGKIHDVAEQYMRDAGLPYNPPKTYAPVDVERAGRIADAFADMKHEPDNPQVKAAYDAMIKETLDQYRALKKMGAKFDFIRPDMEDPYKATPRLAAKDFVDNNHLWVFPTDTGFGTLNAIKDNPLLTPVDEYINGKQLTANDVFRIVHDIFGHFKDGNGFRATGEENAWRSHSAMYSDLARGAMTSETRGQNSWLNYGPYGEKNRTASAADTVYADQKIGLLPRWVIDEGRRDSEAAPMVLYHGTSKDQPFTKFKPARNGTWLTTNPEEASQYAVENDSMGHRWENGRPVPVNRASRVIPVHHEFAKTKELDNWPEEILRASNYKKAQGEYFDKLRAEGYDSVRMPTEGGHSLFVALDNKKLKSVYTGQVIGRARGGVLWPEQSGPSIWDRVRERARSSPKEDFNPDNTGIDIIPGAKLPDEQQGGMQAREIRGYAHGGRVATRNINHEPTEAQKAAGNYAKDHINFHGLQITIENAKGKERTGVGRDGKPWKVVMPAHYGYIKKTEGADGDHVDAYIGPHLKSPHVWIVDQVNADTKKFDEHKAMIGFGSVRQAMNYYVRGFSDGRGQDRVGHVIGMNIPEFKEWLVSGDTTKPISNDKETLARTRRNAKKVSHLSVAYVDPSHFPDRRCELCSMFVSVEKGGPCTLVKDPISPQGYCRRFSRKTRS